MQPSVIEHLCHEPQKLIDLEWLEEELAALRPGSDLGWNGQKQCVEHSLLCQCKQEFELLQHWAEHVGAKIELAAHQASSDIMRAFIYR